MYAWPWPSKQSIAINGIDTISTLDSQVADEIPDRKLLTTNVKPVFRSCLFNIAHSGGDLLLVINNEDLSSHPIRAFQEKSRE